MTPPKKSTTAAKAKAAKAEAEKKAPVAEFRGLELKLPDDLPGSMAFDMFGLGASSDPSAQLRFLNTILGVDQLEKLRKKMDEDGVTFFEVDSFIEELLEAIIVAYGTTVGESQASAKS